MAKETFQRTKPHVNMGTIGPIDRSQSTGLNKSMIVGTTKDQPSNRPRLWPSPHMSTPQLTSKGRQQKAIMYPGARTVAGSMIPGGSVISSAIGTSTSLPGGGMMREMMKQSLQRNDSFHQQIDRYQSRVNVVMSNILKASKG